ncbi:non-specific phospholipase C3-like [Zingiber officinale]|uniref:non-specific phospholipase C3-like n=1 Tax=Zingiber officinale TaxID=94328 RepID=UPI001C4D3FA5|nr:non-specific phospholipase C3-like [Zingiber officinale]
MSTTDASGKIKTVVVLVQENRSFDHMLGWMKTVNPEIDGVSGDRQFFNPISTVDPAAGVLYFGDGSEYVDPDPGHSIQAIYEQVYGVPFVDAVSTPITPPGVAAPPMSGFVQEAERERAGMSETVMNGFRPSAVPVYESLVREFAVCDRWFASVPASTQPNRAFVHSATSNGLTSNDNKRLVAGLPQRTIFDNLHDAGFSFGIYYQFPPSTLFYRNLRRLKYLGNFHQFDLTFKDHCKNGKLPNYVVIEQRYFDLKVLPGNDDHPSHDVAQGQRLVKEIYEALRSSPQWDEILFVITYDEHGGFFDHVPTPVVGVPSPDGLVGPAPFYFNFDRLGVRVPAILVSPWIEPGTVIHEPSGPQATSQFEHSSIPATVKKIFNLKEFLTHRDAWAGTFEAVLTRTTPRMDCPETLPEPKKLRAREAEEMAKLSDLQTDLVQLGAALNGDHALADEYPERLAERMTVADGARYVRNAFKAFLEECERCQKEGVDGSQVVEVVKRPTSVKEDDRTVAKRKRPATTLFGKVFSCLVCNTSQD